MASNCQAIHDVLSQAVQWIKMSQCDASWKKLNSGALPGSSQEHLPAFAWQKNILSGWDSKTDQAVCLDHLSFSTAISSLHPTLSFTDFALLADAFAGPVDDSEIRELAKNYGFRYNEQLKKTMATVREAPQDFQLWAAQKNFGAKDWSLLNPVSAAEMASLLLSISSHQLSYGRGRKVLELCSELVLMSHRPDDLDILPIESAEQWTVRLKNLRFPRSVSEDLERQDIVSSIPHPPHIQLSWRRQGDLSGLHCEFFTLSTKDFDKKLLALQRYEDQLSKKMGQEWTE